MRACSITLIAWLAGCHDWTDLSDHFPPDAGQGPDATSSTGGGGGDAGRDCGPEGPSACPAGVAFCEGFEGPDFAPGIWNHTEEHGVVEVDADCAALGEGSAHARIDALTAGQTGRATITETKSQDGAPATTFVRVWMFVASPVPSETFTLVAFAEQDGTSIAIKQGAGTLFLQGSLLGGPTGSVTMPTDHWTCLEWQIVTGAPGLVRLWLDDGDDPAIDVSPRSFQPPTPFVKVQLGPLITMVAAPTEHPIDVWMDELVVDRERVGCTR